MSQSVIVSRLPKCDFCKDPHKAARYDARVPLFGSWANLCQSDAIILGISLGTGKGQALVLEDEDPTPWVKAITDLVFT